MCSDPFFSANPVFRGAQRPGGLSLAATLYSARVFPGSAATQSITAAPSQPPSSAPCLVLDTNVVLDLFLFHDPATPALQRALDQGQLQWLATAPMREELARVLGYTYIVKSLHHHALVAEQVLAKFDAQARLVPVAPKASVTCKDPDDQKFIDLAVVLKATLLSKDKAVLCMKKRLLALDVKASVAIDSVAV